MKPETRTHKRCARCGATKPVADYFRKTRYSNGGTGPIAYVRCYSQCKPCFRLTRNESYARRRRIARRPKTDAAPTFTPAQHRAWTANLARLRQRLAAGVRGLRG